MQVGDELAVAGVHERVGGEGHGRDGGDPGRVVESQTRSRHGHAQDQEEGQRHPHRVATKGEGPELPVEAGPAATGATRKPAHGDPPTLLSNGVREATVTPYMINEL